MARYKNGEVPASLLSRRGAIRLTAGTWAKWDALVADVKARFNVTLTITQGKGVTSGSGGYRDFAMQKAVKDKYRRLGRPKQAATEGTSSHGGEYKGRDALAVDVNNYWAIPQSELFAAARRAGFTPGVFDGKGGRPLEPWHLIDYDPYRKVEDDMTPEESNQLKQVYNAIFNGGKSMPDGGRSIGASLAQIASNTGPINRDGKAISLRQEVADAKTILIGMEAALEALAVAKGADPAAILKAVQDGVENAMRKVTFTPNIDN